MAAANQAFPGILSTPEYAGNVYDIQTKQALAQALLQKGLQGNLSAYQPAGGGFGYVPAMGIGGALAGSVLPSVLGAALQKQANQELTALGMQQQAALTRMMSPQTVAQAVGGQASPVGVGGMTEGQELGAALGQPQAVTRASPFNPGGIDPSVAARIYSQNPDKWIENVLAYSKPADIVAEIRAAGIDPNSALGQQLAQARIAQKNFIAPTVSSPGQTVTSNMGGGTRTNPFIQSGQEVLGYTPEGRPIVASMIGATQAQEQMEAAKARGAAVLETQEAVRLNPETGRYETYFVPKGAPVAAYNAAVGSQTASAPPANAPLGIRNNNPGNLRPGGQFAQYPDMQTGLAALDKNLQSYGKQGIDTITGVISKWAPPNENDTKGYVNEVAKRLGISPNQKIDLSNPLVRQSISTAIALRENGPSGVFGSTSQQAPQQAAPSGPMMSKPPIGAEAEASAGAHGARATMDKSYEGLRIARDTSQNAITLLDDMQKYATDKNPALANKIFNVQNLYSTNAQLFDKARSNLIAQVAGSTGMGTDQARAIVEGSIPSYGMTSAAIQEGLQDIKNQVQMRRIKSDYMSDAYAGNNARVYNQRENQFDQSMTPRAANIISMPPGPMRDDLIREQAKIGGRDADALAWAIRTGLIRKGQ